MKNHSTVRSGLLSLALVAGATHAGTGTGTAVEHIVLDDMVCTDSGSPYRCLLDLRNGDFEAKIDPQDPHRWQFHAPPAARAPYLGSTTTSRVLALPDRGVRAWTDMPLHLGEAGEEPPKHEYRVRYRARGVGPMPAQVKVTLLVTGAGDPAGTRELISATHSVGWDWEPLTFKVDDIVSAVPARLTLRIERMDNNTPTMLQVDDVRIVRMP